MMSSTLFPEKKVGGRMYLERQVMVSSIVAVETAAVIVNKGHPKEIIGWNTGQYSREMR